METNQLKLIAQGNTAQVYALNSDTILKLFREGIPQALALHEYETSRFIQENLTNVPKAYSIEIYNTRYGIIYERIWGEDMIEIVLHNIFKIKTISQSLAKIHLAIHDHTFSQTPLPEIKRKLTIDICQAAELTDSEKNLLFSYIATLPEGNSLCHFDFHPGNIILNKRSSVVIDWATACIGDPCADVARTYLLLNYGQMPNAGLFKQYFLHLFQKQICRFYFKAYTNLSGMNMEDIQKWILPVAAARLHEWIPDSEKELLENTVQTLFDQVANVISDREKAILLELFESLVYVKDVRAALAELREKWNLQEETPHVHSYTSVVTREATCLSTGLRTHTCSCGHSYQESIPVAAHQFENGFCTICNAVDPDYIPPVVLTGISAVYSGDAVEAGTSLDQLTGLTVTAQYSDGSSAAVEGYTLSGTIAAGSNIITVTYKGKQTTFTVSGIAMVPRTLLYNWDLTQSLTDTVAGKTATLDGPAVQNENGMTISGNTGSCFFPSYLFAAGTMVEIDVAAASHTGAQNGFLIMLETDNATNGTGRSGLTYRYTSGSYVWQMYCGSWQANETNITDAGYIAGKTIRIYRASGNVVSVYFGNTFIATANDGFPSG